MSIRISPKHGVNPAVLHCYFCNKPKNELALLGMLPGDAEAPRRLVADTEPCDECKEYMARGILLISVADGEPDRMDSERVAWEFDHRRNKQPFIPNPNRTGGWSVVREEAVKRWITDQAVCDQIMKARFAFVPDEVWNAIGLPRSRAPDKA